MPKNSNITPEGKSGPLQPSRRKFLRYVAFGGAALALNAVATKMGGVSSVIGDVTGSSTKKKSNTIHTGKDFTLVEKRGELLVYNNQGENLLIIEKD
jgi:hypothetical protein